MKKITFSSTLFVCLLLINACAAQKTTISKEKKYLDLSWKEVATKMPDEWYGSDEAKMVGDSVLKYQTSIGGWPKNSNFHKGVDQEEAARIKSTGIGATFDNGATLTELKFLAKLHSKIPDDRYLKAFNKAFDYILEAQYPNGGWPQFYPFRQGRTIAYNAHITYNDDAMLHVMQFLNDIAEGNSIYSSMHISMDMKEKAKTAFNKGIDCILKTQIRVKGQPTVWCAQHDEVTLLPANARAYELASYSGQESVGLTLLLMEIDNPSKEIVAAVNGAYKWFQDFKITGIRIDTVTESTGLKNRVVVEDPSASPIWARFYDLETGKPYFCDRDGIKKNSLAEIGYERRNGYSWYNNNPDKVIKKYPAWAKKWSVN